jgi:D-glycero-D-manno-heptose 1,7-bisphosphate phosphatase
LSLPIKRIAAGYYIEGEYLELIDWMLANFLEQQIEIARVYHCPYHPIHGIGEYRSDSFDRKPNPGMLERAKGEFDLDLASCLLIGDKLSDIAAGQAAGVGQRSFWIHPGFIAHGRVLKP